jgi:beta-N-acetylhexosaminidase
MTGHLVVPEWGAEPVTINRTALAVLRGELGFTGTVITDAVDMGALAGTIGMAEGAVRAVIAGADSVCVGGVAADEATLDQLVDRLTDAVTTGRLPIERLTAAVARTAAIGVPPTRVGGYDRKIGMIAARRAVVAHGMPRVTGSPLVVELVVRPTLVVEVPEQDRGTPRPPRPGFGAVLADVMPDVAVRRLSMSDASPARDIVDLADGRPLVVVAADPGRYPWMLELIDALIGMGRVIVIDTGAGWPVPGVFDRLDTHGGALVNLRAAAEHLAGHAAYPR